MKFLSRSTVGVVIGCLNVLGFSVTSIYIIKVLCDFGKLTDEDRSTNEDVISKTVTLLYIILVICLIAIIISILLVVGVLKRRHVLMRPWLGCAFAGIVCHIFRLTVGFFAGFLSGGPVGEVFQIFFVGLVFLGIQMLIFYIIYKLYKDVRDKGNEAEVLAAHGEPVFTDNENPPSYGDLERKGELYK